MLFGINDEAPVLLGMIGVNMEYFDRFRDVELIEDGTKIRVFTRLGGGNRDGYEKTWNKIQNHKLYIKDYDDDFDCTYAYIEYSVPDKFKETAKKMFKGEPVSFSDKFKKELEEMDKPGTEAYKKSEKIAKQIAEGLENGNHIITL
jgi:formyltetrahydrofolate synthetase